MVLVILVGQTSSNRNRPCGRARDHLSHASSAARHYHVDTRAGTALDRTNPRYCCFQQEVEPALFYDAKLDLAAMLRPLA